MFKSSGFVLLICLLFGVIFTNRANSAFVQAHELITFSNQDEVDSKAHKFYSFEGERTQKNTPIKQNQENRDKEEKNSDEETEIDKTLSEANVSTFLLNHFDSQVRTKWHLLFGACCNRIQLSKILLYHQWKIDCA